MRREQECYNMFAKLPAWACELKTDYRYWKGKLGVCYDVSDIYKLYLFLL